MRGKRVVVLSRGKKEKWERDSRRWQESCRSMSFIALLPRTAFYGTQPVFSAGHHHSLLTTSASTLNWPLRKSAGAQQYFQASQAGHTACASAAESPIVYADISLGFFPPRVSIRSITLTRPRRLIPSA